jgi:hypothetical protein
MRNKVLFISSTLMVVGNFPFILISQQDTFIKSYYTLGLTTSVLNHGCNSRVLQIADRTAMGVGFFIDLYYARHVQELAFVLLSVSSYFISKKTKILYFHVLAHFFITVAHNKILLHLC